MKVESIDLPIPYHSSMDIIDSTKIQSYQSCPRLFFYEYVLGWRSSRPNNHLHFGKAVHLAMEHIILHGYRVDAVMEALTLFNDEYRASFPESTDVIFTPKTPGRFFDMLLEYLRTYSDDLTRYEVYKTEIGGTINLSPTHTMAFKMDTILYDRQHNRYVSLEHKTKGGNYIGDNYQYDFMLSVQLGTYTHVLNSLFKPEEVGEVIINCLCFKKTKKPEFILQRFPIPLSNAQMNCWLENTKHWIDMIHSDFQVLSTMDKATPLMTCFPLNGRSCTNWGRVCQYHSLCTSWNNPIRHQHQLPADMQIDFWNPLEEELTERMTL